MPSSTANATDIETARSSYELLNDLLLNKGTAFTDAERDAFDLHGLLPPVVATLDEQIGRPLQAKGDLLSADYVLMIFVTIV